MLYEVITVPDEVAGNRIEPAQQRERVVTEGGALDRFGQLAVSDHAGEAGNQRESPALGADDRDVREVEPFS